MTSNTTSVATEPLPVPRKLTYSLYMDFRRDGLSPLAIRDEWVKLRFEKGMSIRGLVSIVIGIVAFVAIDRVLSKLFRKRSIAVSPDSILWVVSPSGETIKSLPFYIALRVIRKHEWELADVEPVHAPSTPLTRWGHLRMVFSRRMS